MEMRWRVPWKPSIRIKCTSFYEFYAAILKTQVPRHILPMLAQPVSKYIGDKKQQQEHVWDV